MRVGPGAAVCSMPDVGVAHQAVFFVDHRRFAAQQNEGVSIVQHPDFVRREQFFATMSSDEFKIGKKIPLLVMRRGIKYDIQKLGSQLFNNIA